MKSILTTLYIFMRQILYLFRKIKLLSRYVENGGLVLQALFQLHIFNIVTTYQDLTSYRVRHAYVCALSAFAT